MRAKVLAAAATVVGLTLLVGALHVLPVLWLALAEDALPPRSDTPALPAGTSVGQEGRGCGSGGCWRELTLDEPQGVSADELAEALGGTGQETCRARNLLDRRRVCHSVALRDGEVVLLLSFDRWLS